MTPWAATLLVNRALLGLVLVTEHQVGVALAQQAARWRPGSFSAHLAGIPHSQHLPPRAGSR
ncbi:hypothetical protein [Alloactinosynnema sp. L-07]|uniref:hypothetical protein n=1 Tax=Alloactinosynnema sp. L-07 TaxID=1653480 RepID=UPI00065F07B0|nr:hypothetical protein [Alloactinosynnema sp. L-07]CRK57044.1 hypothetical protein [Alloactinosynnema sp. L-07]